MTKEKISFKDYSPESKMLVPVFYGCVALMAVMTGYAIKYKKEDVGRFVFGTGMFASSAVFTHLLARDEARRMREEKNKQRD